MGTCIFALGALVIVDRIEGDRVVIEWCDRTTSDLPVALFPRDVAEGAVLTLAFQPLPVPNTARIAPHVADRPVSDAPDQRGKPRTETQP